jgi:pilus assembly protein CpaF
MSTNQSAMRGMRATPATPSSAGSYADIRERVQRRLLMELNPQVDARNLDQVRPALEQIFGEIMAEEQLPMSRVDRARLFDDIVADILGLGPLEAFLSDDSVSEILVNGPDQVFVERGGILRETDVRFRDAAEVMRIIDRIVAPLGRRVDESSPMVDARLLDGSRVNVIIPPLALNGPCISIRKFARVAFTGEDMIRMGALTAPMVAFLQACVRARLNILVSGGTSTGKTTILNLLSGFLPSNERIITIETPPSCSSTSATWCGWRPVRRTWRGVVRYPSASWSSTRCVCAPIVSSWARCAAARPWTCCRP